MNVTSNDIKTAKLAVKCIFAKVTVLNKGFFAVGQLFGTVVSGSVSISADTAMRRSARLTLELSDADKAVSADRYLKLSCGLEDISDNTVKWFDEGIFIAVAASISTDCGKTLLTLTLSDLMTDLTGERGGALKGFEFIAKSGEKISTVVKNVLEISGVKMYDVCEIKLRRETDGTFDEDDSDSLIPYDLKFPAGTSAFDIIKKCVGLYPYYEFGFDGDGVFFCRLKPMEDDPSLVVLDASQLDGLIISEEKELKYTDVKNCIEVWGKNGLYHGEAVDLSPDSPFNAAACGEIKLVVSGSMNGVDAGSICDRYKDYELAAELDEERAQTEVEICALTMLSSPSQEELDKLSEAQTKLSGIISRQKTNISVSGDSLAEQWAQRILYEKSRLYDRLTLKTVFSPFLNDADFKLSYRSRADGKLGTYVVKDVSHDLGAGTTTLQCVRFYNEQCSAYMEMLQAPQITGCYAQDMTLSVSVTSVEHAQGYTVYIDSKPAVKGAGTSLSVTLPVKFAGKHRINVTAYADGYRESPYSNTAEVTFKDPSAADLLTAEDGSLIITENNESIIISEVT